MSYYKKLTLTPVTCPRCQKTILWFQYRYPIYLEWRTDYPWKYCLFRRWEVCKKCYDEYNDLMKKKWGIKDE